MGRVEKKLCLGPFWGSSADSKSQITNHQLELNQEANMISTKSRFAIDSLSNLLG